MAVRISTRQVKNNAILTRITAATNSGLDTILSSLNSLTTPPFVMTPSSPVDQKVNIGSVTVTNATIGASSTVAPLSGVIPSFSSGYVTFPTASGGNAVPSAGSSLAITISISNFIKVGIAIDSTGNIVLTVGTQGASIAAAGTPSVPSSTIPVGFVVLQNIGGTIQTITGSSIYQYAGSGSGSGGGMTLSVQTASFSAVTNTSYLVSASGGAVTVTLPVASLPGTVIRFTDIAQTWGNPNTVTLNGGSNNIHYNGSLDTSLILNLPGTWLEVLWDSTNSRWATRDAYWPLNNQLTGDLTIQGNLTVTGSFSQTYPIKTSAYTAIAGDTLLANTSGGAFTITLPAAPNAGQTVVIYDAKKTFATNNLTVARNGLNINGSGTNFVGNTNGLKVTFIYIDVSTGWSTY